MGRALRGTRLEDYGISKERYNIIRHFIGQYGELKSGLRYGVNERQLDAMPRGYNTADPTAKNALYNLAAMNQISAIDAALDKAAAGYPQEVRAALLQSFAGMGYWDFPLIPIGATDFSALRRLTAFYVNEYLTGAIADATPEKARKGVLIALTGKYTPER